MAGFNKALKNAQLNPRNICLHDHTNKVTL